MRTTSTTPTASAALALALAVAGVLAGCSPEPAPAEVTSEAAPPPSPSATPTPDPAPTQEPPVEDTDALPPGFPDPETLIGQEMYDEQAEDGSWHTVVAGAPLELTTVFASCFAMGGDVCANAIFGAAPAGPGGVTQPTDAGLVLLTRYSGSRPDGSAIWSVLDALVTRTPGGVPAYLQGCDDEPGVAIYADTAAGTSSTIPVLAAWGPDAGVSALVELDPTSVTCQFIGH